MKTLLKKSAQFPLAFACALTATTPAFAQSNAELLQEIRALKSRLQDLEKKVSETPAAAVPAPPAPTSDKPGSTAKPDDRGFVKWNELVVGKSKFKLYGFLRLDAIFDDSRPSDTHIVQWIRSEDPKALGVPAAAPIGSLRNSGDFSINPRLTRFGIDFTGPEIEALGGAKVTGKTEIDFYNLPSSESRNAPRMRHAYVKLAWDDISVLAGQTSDVISPMFPAINPDMIMWNAGNLGDRRPQFRMEYTPKVGPGQFVFQSEVGSSGVNDAQDLDPAANGGFKDGETSALPTLQARLAYRLPVGKQNAELGFWGHRAWQKTDTAIGTSGRHLFNSYVYGLDLSVPVYRDIVTWRSELWQGQNLSDVRGGIAQAINLNSGREVHAWGGWSELSVRPVKWYSVHGGYAIDNPRNGDLVTVPAGVGRAENDIWYLGVRGYFDPIEIGFDYMNWTTKYIGFGKGTDNRFQSFISYKF